MNQPVMNQLLTYMHTHSYMHPSCVKVNRPNSSHSTGQALTKFSGFCNYLYLAQLILQYGNLNMYILAYIAGAPGVYNICIF